MNKFTSLKEKQGSSLCAIALAIALSFVSLVGVAADAKSDKAAKTEKKGHKKSKKLTGAELYAIHCNRCHPERYAPERTAAHWKTILTHMRVRANLPAAQAREILKFLEEDSGK